MPNSSWSLTIATRERYLVKLETAVNECDILRKIQCDTVTRKTGQTNVTNVTNVTVATQVSLRQEQLESLLAAASALGVVGLLQGAPNKGFCDHSNFYHNYSKLSGGGTAQPSSSSPPALISTNGNAERQSAHDRC